MCRQHEEAKRFDEGRVNTSSFEWKIRRMSLTIGNNMILDATAHSKLKRAKPQYSWLHENVLLRFRLLGKRDWVCNGSRMHWISVGLTYAGCCLNNVILQCVLNGLLASLRLRNLLGRRLQRAWCWCCSITALTHMRYRLQALRAQCVFRGTAKVVFVSTDSEHKVCWVVVWMHCMFSG